MSVKCISSLTVLLGCAILVVVVCGCSKEQASETKPAPAKVQEPAKVPEPVKSEADIEGEAKALLAKADVLDGQADKVITKCASCMLKMDGKPEHSLKAFDYTMYFCTERCATTFGKDLTKSILAMEIPED